MLRAMLIVAFVALAICVTSSAACMNNDDCEAYECCQLFKDMPTVGSRGSAKSGGFCTEYFQKDEQCSMNDSNDGICGCAPGLKCTAPPHRIDKRVYFDSDSEDRIGICQ